MQPIDPNSELDVTLQAQEWNIVMEIIAKSTGFPYVVTSPIIDKVKGQLQNAAMSLGQKPERGNHHDHPERTLSMTEADSSIRRPTKFND